MDSAPDIATTLQAWLRHFDAVPPAPTFRGGGILQMAAPADTHTGIAALAALAAEALARERSLWIVTADDSKLPELSNALDLALRPLCLVLPGADYAGRITLRASFSLLNSRLTRAAGDSEGPVWAAMRVRLQEQDDLWHACLAWGQRGLDAEAPPPGFADLFPVCIGPAGLAQRLDTFADWVVLADAARLPNELRTPWPGARLTLLLDAPALFSGRTTLACVDEISRLRAEIEVMGQELAEMELELATAQAELAGFSDRYHACIAGRIAELDRLLAELAERRMHDQPHDPQCQVDAAAAAAQAERSQADHAHYRQQREQAARGIETPAFAPDKQFKKRFRQLAQQIHPDRASNESERAWRTQLMSEANRAYRAGDAAALEEVFALWHEGQQGESNTRATAARSAKPAGESVLQAQATRIRQRLSAIAGELDQLYGSKLYELFSAARMAARQGRDLIDEIAAKLDAQIDATRIALAQYAASDVDDRATV